MSYLALLQPTVEQLSAIAELDKSCFGGFWTIEGYQRELASSNSQLLVLSTASYSRRELVPQLLQESSPEKFVGIGCFWSILEEAHITILGVHPDYQGQGLGQLLLYALLRDAVEWGLERATLEVRVSNKAALSLYEKFGFKCAGQRRKYYKEPVEDALILWLAGLQSPEFAQNLGVWEQLVCDRLALSSWQLDDSFKNRGTADFNRSRD